VIVIATGKNDTTACYRKHELIPQRDGHIIHNKRVFARGARVYIRMPRVGPRIFYSMYFIKIWRTEADIRDDLRGNMACAENLQNLFPETPGKTTI